MKKTIFTLAIALIGSAVMMAAPIKVGDTDIYYEITGTAPAQILTFSGSGNLPDYGFGQAPWAANAASITDIILGENIDGVGYNAFSNFMNLKNMTLYSTNPDGVQCSAGGVIFGNVMIGNATLYVPFEKINMYKAIGIWQDFGAILPISCPTAGKVSGNTNTPTDSISWVISGTTLTFSGKELIGGYYYDLAPWTCDAASITNIILGEGIFGFGSNVFTDFVNLQTMTVNSTTPDGEIGRAHV